MYRKIADYGVIGDMRTAALVSPDGSIDYCSLPHFDSPTLFAALLDEKRGGCFSLKPAGAFSSKREYLPDTCILCASFTNENGAAKLCDFMPVEDSPLRQRPQGIHRCISVERGRMDFVLTFAPRPGYGLDECVIAEKSGGFTITRADPPLTLRHTLSDFRTDGIGTDTLTLTFSLQAGESAHFDLLCGQPEPEEKLPCPFNSTRSWWEEWVRTCIGEHCAWLGEFTPLVHRSLLTLKLLTFQPTGAIVAAATTSLPESIGEARNWDYRFTWLRDASFTLKAFFALGHIGEADSFIRWLHDTYRNNGSRELMIMYSIHGQEALHEKHLDHLDGYRHSRPVRVGNAARTQQQWDIYGEIMDAALRLSGYAGKIDEALWPFFREICEMAIENWKKPDDGIWEVRNGPYHFVYSKVMCWVALDRGITLARQFRLDAPLERWEREREAIRTAVLTRGFSAKLNSFVQRFDTEILDASLLILPLVSFLPLSDPRIEGTIEACRRELMEEGFIRRYKADDGLAGEEGGFLLCNFWMIECLALSGNIIEAEKLMSATMNAANDLGLFSEEYDPRAREMLGNFPQAFSHIGYINAVTALLSGKLSPGEQEAEPSLIRRMSRMIPLKLTLNSSPHPPAGAPGKIDAGLKIMAGRLRNGFVDTERNRIDYAAMKPSASFKEYRQFAQGLQGFDPASLRTDQERKAFWINIYNLLIMHGVIALDIRRSVLEIVNFFGRIGYDIGGQFFTPDEIEHGILRKNRPHPAFPIRPFKSSDPRLQLTVESFDPRIDFALVCASASSPRLDHYDAETIDRQLDSAARRFIGEGGLELDEQKRELRLSRIFQWYARDFGQNQDEVVNWVLEFCDDSLRERIISMRSELRVRYQPYDWNLNRAES